MIVMFLGNAIALRNVALALDEQETKMLVEAGNNVAQYYNIPVSAKTQAWIGLGGTIFTIYSAKIAAIKLASRIELSAK